MARFTRSVKHLIVHLPYLRQSGKIRGFMHLDNGQV
jgi:hypothetical protein